MIKYDEYYVAYLDILGFKELLRTASCESIYQIFDILHKKTRGHLNLNGVEIQAYQHIHHTILSDSVIVYIKASVEDAFAVLIDICKNLQSSLANREAPILLRGGVAKGALFHENDIIYGEGLSKAYLLESNLAKHPRIVFSGELLEDGLKNTKYMFAEMEGLVKPYKTDDDRLYYIDYLEISMMGIDLITYFDQLQAMCNSYLNKEIDEGLRSKYLWLLSKIEKKIAVISFLREHYSKKEEEEDKRKSEEYSKRFSIYPKQFHVRLVENTDEEEQNNG
ncbi:hypothetical protein [Congzhengia minquanensis]|uniref:Guanylate cyclase domain-containing protein n=1 Tax=Congzhengia minquanensis TaxID=2763657 RepID=A0A926I071_9FIRM|nr:hypothetical protein [Congzhengia minquanensis]MBC8541626.1 hypothetical protein [Congzhengia minquanensis]